MFELELRQLKYLVRVTEAGSISRAADSLHIAQPALSLQLSNLEEELGVKLFTRTSRGVVPTDKGRSISRQARSVLSHVDTLRALAAQEDEEPVGVVRLGLPGTLASLLGLRLLQELRSQRPRITLEIIEGPSWYLTQMVVDGKLDLSLLYESAFVRGLSLTALLTEPLVLVGSRGSLQGLKGVTATEVCELPLVGCCRSR